MIGEFALIDRLARHLSPEGGRLLVASGDDAAVVDLEGRAAVLATDALVEGRHWHRRLSRPEDVGWKAIAVNCSDLAAMGADPVAAVIALQSPAGMAESETEDLYRGMAEAARRYGLDLAGGDTVAAEALSVSVAILGAVEPSALVRRSGARPGDALICVGALGEAAAGLAEALGGDDAGDPDPGRADPRLLDRHRRPRALLAAGRALAGAGAGAMIDVSDGLGADLGHICRASGVSARVLAGDLPLGEGVAAAADRLGVDPLELACGGEDFALLAALPQESAARAARAAGRAEGVEAAVIGTIEEPGEPLVALECARGVIDLSGMGYDHYGGGPG